MTPGATHSAASQRSRGQSSAADFRISGETHDRSDGGVRRAPVLLGQRRCFPRRAADTIFRYAAAILGLIGRARATRVPSLPVLVKQSRPSDKIGPRLLSGPRVCPTCLPLSLVSPLGHPPCPFRSPAPPGPLPICFLFFLGATRRSACRSRKIHPHRSLATIRPTTSDSGGSRCFPSVRQSFRS